MANEIPWWHAAPTTQPEVDRLRNRIYNQLKELKSQGVSVDSPGPTVTCPCGFVSLLLFASRCHHCGLWICRRCADEHFGPPPSTVKENVE